MSAPSATNSSDRRLRGFRLQLAGLLLAAPAFCFAATDAAASSDGAAVLDAGANAASLVDMLEKMTQAADNRNYQGVFILRKDDQLSALRVYHGKGEHGVWESLESLTGEARRIIRDDRQIVSIYPDKKQLIVRKAGREFGARHRLPANLRKLEKYYRFESVGNDRIAGYPTLVVDLNPRDSFRYGYRYWLQNPTGMLLRCDLFDHNNAIVEQMMFTELDYLDVMPERAWLDMKTLAGYDSRKLVEDKISLPGRWRVDQPPPGFELVGQHRLRTQWNGPLLQLVYSDGLASVSVFVEDYRDAEAHLQGASSKGAIHAFGQRKGAYNVTAVGEVPARTVKVMAQSLRHQAADAP